MRTTKIGKSFLIALAAVTLPTTTAKADSLELVGGGITYHLNTTSAHARWYHYHIGGGGRLIDNPILGIRRVQDFLTLYTSQTVFIGYNSVGGQMAGATGSIGGRWYGFYTGGVLGVYEQHNSPFERYNLFALGQYGIVPVLGIEVNYRVDLGDNVYMKINNLLTPVITNSSLSIGFNL